MPYAGWMRAVLIGLTLSFATTGSAQYPDRPVTAITGFPASGLADLVLRATVEGMREKFPKGIVVVNRTGAGGALGAGQIVQAKPDGYTFGLVALSNLVIGPQISDLPYKTPDDYTTVINLVAFYPILGVKADAPWKDGKAFLAAAASEPGKLGVGTPGEGTSSHLNLEELKRLAQVNLTHVPFRGWAESSVALLGGHIAAVVAQPGELKPQVDAGKMRLLGVFQPQRSSFFPQTPTWQEQGLAARNGALFLLIAPNGMPAEALKYIHDAARASIEATAFQAFAKARAIEVDFRSSEQLKKDVWDEYRAHTEILARLGMLKK